MRKFFMLFVLTIGLMSTSSAAENRPEMSRYTTAYSGGEGFRVWVARFGPKENQEALVQISGIDHKFDGRVIRAKVIPGLGGNSVKYVATVDGQAYELLHAQAGKAQLLVTGTAWPSELCFDKSLVDDRPPQHLLTDYLDSVLKK